MNIAKDFVDSILDDKAPQPYNSGLLAVFYASSIALILVWTGMLWLVVGTEFQMHVLVLLFVTFGLLASVSWFVYESSKSPMVFEEDVSEVEQDCSDETKNNSNCTLNKDKND